MAAQTSSKSLLIVEDEEEFLEIVTENLISRGFRVQGTSKAKDGILRAKNQKYDLILCDINLGPVSGKDVIMSIRTDKTGFNVKSPILVMSGNLDIETVKEIRAYVQGVIVKPFEIDALVERIHPLVGIR